MAVLNLNDLKPGMVLAAPVYNKNGGLLLNKGVALTEKHLKIFKIWGVTEADIESYDKEKVEEEAYSLLNEEDMEKIDSMLKTRFFDFSSNEVMAEIYRITKKQKIKSYIKGIESR